MMPRPRWATSLRLFGLLVGMAACVPVAATTAMGVENGGEAVVASDASVPSTAAITPSPEAEAAVAPVCPTPDEIVRRLQARYDETRAFRADFEQETFVMALGEHDQARGTVAFSKPGRMRWTFAEPTPQLIISDGTTLWIYQPEDQQVLRAVFRAAFVSTTPVSFLAGVGRITDDFRPRAAQRTCSATRAYVQLEAKDPHRLGGLELSVDRATFDIVEASVTDPLGNVTTLRFTDMQRNVEIPDKEFVFTVPEGVDVIVAPGSAPPL